MQTALPTYYTMPKSSPTVEQNSWIPERSIADLSPYIDLDQIEFGITGKKKVDKRLEVIYVGQKSSDGRTTWAITLGTPSCFVSFTPNMFENEARYSRALLCPAYRELGAVEKFLPFLDYVEALSNKLKQIMTLEGYDVSKWRSPMKTEHGTLVGLQAKVRSEMVRQQILASSSNLRCCLKLTCVYFNSDQSAGLTFELAECVPS
jgi:hypothetical protein